MAGARWRRVITGAGLLLVGLLVILVASLAWLRATAPGPRDVDGWSLGPPLPSERGELATTAAHAGPCPEPPCPEAERLFVLGGLGGLGRVQDRVSIYDPVRRQWQAGPPLPAPRHHLAAAGLDRYVYVSGGSASLATPWQPEADLWRLEVGAEAWEALEPMPEPRWGHRMVVHGGRLFVVGGAGPSSRVLIYTPGAGWEDGAPLPVQRDHLSVVVATERIWAIGGRTPESLARVDIYDPLTDSWEPGPDLPAVTSGAAEGVLDGVILILGGEEMDLVRGEVFDRHWMLDSSDEAPSWAPAPAPPLTVHGTDGAIFQGTLVIVGGAARHGALSVTAWTDAMQWLEARPLRPE